MENGEWKKHHAAKIYEFHVLLLPIPHSLFPIPVTGATR